MVDGFKKLLDTEIVADIKDICEYLKKWKINAITVGTGNVTQNFDRNVYHSEYEGDIIFRIDNLRDAMIIEIIDWKDEKEEVVVPIFTGNKIFVKEETLEVLITVLNGIKIVFDSLSSYKKALAYLYIVTNEIEYKYLFDNDNDSVLSGFEKIEIEELPNAQKVFCEYFTKGCIKELNAGIANIMEFEPEEEVRDSVGSVVLGVCISEGVGGKSVEYANAIHTSQYIELYIKVEDDGNILWEHFVPITEDFQVLSKKESCEVYIDYEYGAINFKFEPHLEYENVLAYIIFASMKKDYSYLENSKDKTLRDHVISNSDRDNIAVSGNNTLTINEEYIDGQHEKVQFLGKSYTLPASYEIREYRDLMNSVLKAYERVNDALNGRIEHVKEDEKKHNNNGFYLQMEFWDDFFGRGDGVDMLLDFMELASLDVCPSGDDNIYYDKMTNGYRSMIKLGDAMEQMAKAIYYERERDIEFGQQTAYRNAASNITGMSYGIITNSAVDLLVYNAVSNATLKSQARKADEQYAKESGAAARRAYSAYARQMVELYYDQFVPAARRCISVWTNEMTERALAYEIRNGHSVFQEIKQYNQQESDKVLERIKSSTSQEETIRLLHQAFELCPFNLEICKKAAQIGVLDLITIQLFMSYACSATGYSISTEIICEIKSYCQKKFDNRCIVDEQCELLLHLRYGKTKKEILENIFATSISNLKNSYNELKKVVSDEREVISFVKNRLHCGTTCTKFAKTSKETIEGEVKCFIDGCTKGINVQLMLDEKVISFEDFTKDNLKDISDINKTYFESISASVLKYNEKMQKELRKYENAKLLYDEEMKNKKATLDKLEQEKDSLSIFKFNRKKELEALIYSKKDEISKFEKERPMLNWC